MTRFLLVLTALAVAGTATQGQGPDQGAVFRQPWDTPRPQPAAGPAPADAVQNLWGKKPAALPFGSIPARPDRDAYSFVPTANIEINRDIEVTPKVGPWMICIISYSGPDAPQKARQMVGKLRESYRLPAYVFNYGAAEKRKEYERLKAQLEKQHEMLEKQRALLRTQMPDQEITIRAGNLKITRIQEYCGILVGGYPNDDAAKAALDQVRKLNPKNLLDPRTVQALNDPTNKEALTDPLLESHFYVKEDSATGKKTGESTFVNPFLRAFVVRNPTLPSERVAESDKMDMEILRKLNGSEEYSLLKCRKPYTLVIKQFQTPTTTRQRGEGQSAFLQAVGLAKGMREDAAAENAIGLAKVLRQMKLDAYVMHTRFASIVSVGNYDSLEDPNLLSMQNLLENRLRVPDPRLQLLPRPLPMLIPH